MLRAYRAAGGRGVRGERPRLKTRWAIGECALWNTRLNHGSGQTLGAKELSVVGWRLIQGGGGCLVLRHLISDLSCWRARVTPYGMAPRAFLRAALFEMHPVAADVHLCPTVLGTFLRHFKLFPNTWDSASRCFLDRNRGFPGSVSTLGVRTLSSCLKEILRQTRESVSKVSRDRRRGQGQLPTGNTYASREVYRSFRHERGGVRSHMARKSTHGKPD